MPSNIIQINFSDELTWQMGDSKMDNLIAYLDQNGFRYHNKKEDNKDEKKSDV